MRILHFNVRPSGLLDLKSERISIPEIPHVASAAISVPTAKKENVRTVEEHPEKKC